tara:strand:+ start:493 stop:963 length:471 start_codon:yes stop_codon:yes gene_type:complete
MTEEIKIQEPIEEQTKPEENTVENTKETKPEENTVENTQEAKPEEIQNNIKVSNVIKSTDESFDTLVKENKIIIFDFWASWCKPCLQISPILDEISLEIKDVIIAKHNLDEEPNKPTLHGVRGIPTMLLFKDGELKSTKIGATPKSHIVSWIKENI